MSIRSSVKAIIVHDGKILLNLCKDKYGDYYSLPGGGQNQYESLYDAVIRECLEETGYTIIPIKFAAFCEVICQNEEYRHKYPEHTHKMYHIFICEITTAEIKIPTEKDSTQIESKWVDIHLLNSIRLYPNAVGKSIVEIIDSNEPLFLGSELIDSDH